MRPILPITIACWLGAAALLWLRLPPLAWALLAAAYLAVVTWGVVSMRSGVFGRARTSGPPSRPEVALTYDDGPDSLATAALLDLLRTRGVPSAFFVVGRNARAHPDLVRRARDEGHLLANHSDRHAWWTNFLSGSRLLREMEACATALEETTGERPRHYRPPVGLMNPSVAPAAAALGLTLVGWSVRSLDRTRRTAEQVASRVLRRVRAGDIILLHDGGQAPDRIVRITERILDGLSARGLRAVRLDRLWR